jgi:hypothetical protein
MIHQASQGLASLGRNGDSMLVHMNPKEVAGLQGLAMAQGGSLTINPDTGLPEAFSLGNFFTSILPTIVGGVVGGPMGAGAVGGLLSGAATGAILAKTKGEDPLMGGVMGGLGGWGGAGIGKGFMAAANPANLSNTVGSTIGNAATTVGNVGGTGEIGSSLLKSGVTPGAETTLSSQISPFTNNTLGSSLGVAPGTNTAAAGSITPGGYDAAGNSFTGGIDNITTGAKNLVGLGDTPGTQAAAYKAASAATPNFGTKLALTGGQALLGGLEPSDLYGEPIKDDEYKYNGLYLNKDSGLRLVAKGGYIKKYALGGNVGNPSVGGGLSDLYNRPEGATAGYISNDGYGMGRLDNLATEQSKAQAKTLGYAMGGYLNGGGDGMSDSIPATIEGKQPARLADGEFVIPADVVSHLGNGSSKAGSKRLYAMLDKVRQARTGTKKQGKQINPNKYMPA